MSKLEFTVCMYTLITGWGVGEGEKKRIRAEVGLGGGLKDTNKRVLVSTHQISVLKLLELLTVGVFYNYRLLITDMLDNNDVSKLGSLMSRVF